MLVRNGEQVLLTIAIPIVLLIATRDLVLVATTTIIATMLTSLAISTGFERRSGALRFLGTTPLTRFELLTGKVLAQGSVLVLSLALAALVALWIGTLQLDDLDAPSILGGVLALLLGSAAFAAWGLLLGGAIRAEATLAIANAAFLALVGLAFATLPPIGVLIPSVALDSALADAGTASAVGPLAVLLAWSVSGAILATRGFRWD